MSTAHTIATHAATRLADLTIPDRLRDSLDRHHANLAQLAVSLLDAGLERQQVEQAVVTVQRSYRQELVRTILSEQEQCDAL